MKKALIFIIISIMCILPLTACSTSTDFSQAMNENLNNIKETVREFAEPYLKQDEKYNTNHSHNTDQVEPDLEVAE